MRERVADQSLRSALLCGECAPRDAAWSGGARGAAPRPNSPGVGTAAGPVPSTVPPQPAVWAGLRGQAQGFDRRRSEHPDRKPN